MIGAILNATKGINENSKLKAEKIKLENEIQEINSFNRIEANIQDPYERLMVRNKFLMAQSIGNSANIFKWEKVKKEMVKNVEKLEEELKSMHATKLDIARIVTALTQLSTEFDMELTSREDKIEEHIEEFKNKQKNLTKIFNENLEELEKIKMKFRTNEELTNKITSIEKQKGHIKRTVENYIEILSEVQKEIEQLKISDNDINGILIKQDFSLQKLNIHIESIQSLTSAEFERISMRIDEQEKNCQQMLNNQQANLRNEVLKIDKQIAKQNRDTEELKKLVWKLTIPLYLASAGVITSLFLI